MHSTTVTSLLSSLVFYIFLVSVKKPMQKCIGFFYIFDKNQTIMKKIKFILPAWDAENNKPFEVNTEIELSEERANEAIRLGVAEEVTKPKAKK